MPASTRHIIKRFQKESTPTQHEQRRTLVKAQKANDQMSAEDLADLQCVSTEASVPTSVEESSQRHASQKSHYCRRHEKAEICQRPPELDGFQSLLSLGCRTFDGPDYIRLLSYLLSMGKRDHSFETIARKLVSAQINRTDIINNTIVTSEYIPRYDLIISENPICTASTQGRYPTLLDFKESGFLRSILNQSGRLSGQLDLFSFILPIRDASTPYVGTALWGCWRALLSLPRVSAEQANCDALVLSSTLFIIANEELPKNTPLLLPNSRSFEQSLQ